MQSRLSIMFDVQRGLCHYCRKLMTRERNEVPTMATIDHKYPICKGGSNRGDNVIACCKRCNNLKGDMTELEFRALITRPAKPKHVEKKPRSRSQIEIDREERKREERMRLGR